MKLLFIINFILLLLSSLCSVYLWILAFFGVRIRKPPSSVKCNRFAILIPAHNEENNIDTLINSLKALCYPKDLYDCYFGADHCVDRTAEKIRNQGFICYEKNDGFPGKGKMLSWLTKKILEEHKGHYTAVVYFDADDQVHPDFLRVVNDSLNAGNEIIQGNSNILNWKDSVFNIINYINVLVTNRLKENSRRNAGLSCFLRGHAMCFRTSVLNELDWSGDSLVEDEELFLRIILKGKKIVWEGAARVENRIPSTMSEAKNQRLRWSRGKIALLRERSLPMLRSLLKNFNWVSLDACLVLLMPTNSVLVGLSFLTWLLSFLFLKEHSLILCWSSALVFSYFLYFLWAAILEKISVKAFLYFLVSPVFIFWRLWIYLMSLKTIKVKKWR